MATHGGDLLNGEEALLSFCESEDALPVNEKGMRAEQEETVQTPASTQLLGWAGPEEENAINTLEKKKKKASTRKLGVSTAD